MVAKCTNCGAHLPPVDPGASHVRCRFCQLEQEVRVAAPRPPIVIDVHPPGAHPLPPPTRPRGTSGALVMVVFAIAVAMGVAALVFFSTVRSPGHGPGAGGLPVAIAVGGGLDQSALAQLSMNVTPERMQSATGVAAGPDFRMRVPLAGSRFDAVTFEWDKERTSHVQSFYFNCSGVRPEDEAIRQRLRTALGRRFDKATQYHWQDASLYFDGAGGVLSVSIHPDDKDKSARWQKQNEALWDAARFAIGLPVKVDEAAMRDWLGKGYPLSSLAKVDPQIDIDESHDALAKLFPGVASKPFIDLDHVIAIDHPWYGEATLSWKNKKGARLATVMLRPPPDAPEHGSHFANQAEIDACVEHTFGPPKKKSEPDHLSGDYDTWWQPPGGGEVRVYKHLVKIELSDFPLTKPMSSDTWKKTILALDACGRR